MKLDSPKLLSPGTQMRLLEAISHGAVNDDDDGGVGEAHYGTPLC